MPNEQTENEFNVSGPSIIDQEFAAADSEGSNDLERRFLENSLVEEILYDWSDVSRIDEKNGSAKHLPFLEQKWGDLYITPGIDTAGRSDLHHPVKFTRRTTDHDRSHYFRTPKRIIYRVPQNRIVVIDKSVNPYLLTTMNFDSCLVASSADRIYVAHLGYSEVDMVKDTLKFFQDQGIPTESIFAFINPQLPESHVGHKNIDYDRRPAELSDYLDSGLKPDRIIQYRYSSTDEKLEGMAGVLTTRNDIYSYSFDLSWPPQLGDKQLNIRDEKLFTLPNLP